ncbi:MAG: DUF2914 domain-containing protein [Desulfuromonadaceae bacterium]|jgi:hypothetical protein
MKRFIRLALVFWFLLVLPVSVLALEVAEGVITTQIVERRPVDAVHSYPATSDRLFCFTRIAGAVGESRVFHVWYWEEREMARVELPVKSADWRTWSSKTLLPEWAGSWRVEILDGEGKLLETFAFNLL